jgi:hypothetical protein
MAQVFSTKDDVAAQLCVFVARKAKEAIDASGIFQLGVAGGSLLDL